MELFASDFKTNKNKVMNSLFTVFTSECIDFDKLLLEMNVVNENRGICHSR